MCYHLPVGCDFCRDLMIDASNIPFCFEVPKCSLAWALVFFPLKCFNSQHQYAGPSFSISKQLSRALHANGRQVRPHVWDPLIRPALLGFLIHKMKLELFSWDEALSSSLVTCQYKILTWTFTFTCNFKYSDLQHWPVGGSLKKNNKKRVCPIKYKVIMGRLLLCSRPVTCLSPNYIWRPQKELAHGLMWSGLINAAGLSSADVWQSECRG